MREREWYERIEELLHENAVGDWNKIISISAQAYVKHGILPERTEDQLLEILHGLIRKMQGFPPTWLAIIANEEPVKTPDDMWIQPAWNEIEVQNLWDEHDGRSHGTMVVGVYVWHHENRSWERDMEWGILGQENRPGRADPKNKRDRLG